MGDTSAGWSNSPGKDLPRFGRTWFTTGAFLLRNREVSRGDENRVLFSLCVPYISYRVAIWCLAKHPLGSSQFRLTNDVGNGLWVKRNRCSSAQRNRILGCDPSLLLKDDARSALKNRSHRNLPWVMCGSLRAHVLIFTVDRAPHVFPFFSAKSLHTININETPKK